MNGLPPTLNKVIESFTRFPGIGKKTAHRLGLHVLKSHSNEIEEFAQALFDAVWKGLQDGKSVDELKESIKLPKFSHWNGYEEHLPAHVERMAYSIWHGN